MALPRLSNDTQQGVVRSAHRGHQHVPGLQRPIQGAGDGVGAVDELDAHQGGLRAEELGIDLVQLVPAQVVIAVAGGAGKISLRHPVILEGLQHPDGIFLRNGVDAVKLLSQVLLRLTAQGADPLTDL